MTTNLRSLNGVILAALLALSLWISAVQSVAGSRPFGSPNLFDPGASDNTRLLPRPAGHFGVSWE